MRKHILHIFLILFIYSTAYTEAVAQEDQWPYTGNNKILVTLEGVGQRYEFISQHLLVRHNKDTQRLECILPVASLVPLNDTIPATMAFEVLFGSKYPELLIGIEAPVQQFSGGRFTPATITMNRSTTIRLQGVNNDTTIPVAFLPENNTLYFSTNFELMLDNFKATLPVKYLPVLTGRVLFSIDKAQWFNLRQ